MPLSTPKKAMKTMTTNPAVPILTAAQLDALERAQKHIDGYLYDWLDADGRAVTTREYHEARECVDTLLPALLSEVRALRAQVDAQPRVVTDSLGVRTVTVSGYDLRDYESHGFSADEARKRDEDAAFWSGSED